MRYALIADIHANLQALTAALNTIDTLHVDRILCLGDLVGYHADPNACIQIIRERRITCIAGNHDRAAAGLREPSDFCPTALRAIQWTRQHLTPDAIEFLSTLPLVQSIDDQFLLVHGALHPEPNDTVRIETNDHARASFDILRNRYPGIRFCFFGHTHIPGIFRDKACPPEPRTALSSEGALGARVGMAPENLARVHLDPNALYLINPGSVGRPRDADPRASFAVYDSASQTIEFHRVPFDRRTREATDRKAGLIRTPNLLRKSLGRLRQIVQTAVYGKT